MNRAFIYGDLVFETIRVADGIPQLLTLHFKRLVEGARLLKFEHALSYDIFSKAIVNSISNSQRKTARVRFILYRNAEGFYTPTTNKTAYEVEVFPLTENTNHPIKTGIYSDNYKPCTELSSLKSGNALLYVMAGIFAKEHGWDDAILLNEHGCICEATSSNIFIVKNEKVYTPALTEGCVAGVMREHTLEQLRHAEYEIHETVISPEQLLDADAVFLTNALRGVVPVCSIGDQLFTSHTLLS